MPQTTDQRIWNAEHDVRFYEAAAIFLAKAARKAKTETGFLVLGRSAQVAQRKAETAKKQLRQLRKQKVPVRNR